MSDWIEWVEPFVGSDPVYMRVSPETAIRKARAIAILRGWYYQTDQDALDDFMSVHWAVRKTDYVLPEVGKESSMNLNDSVSVELTEFGLEVERTYWLGCFYHKPETGNKRTTQLWCLMEMFGPHLHIGADSPFVRNQIVRKTDSPPPEPKVDSQS